MELDQDPDNGNYLDSMVAHLLDMVRVAIVTLVECEDEGIEFTLNDTDN